LWVSWGMNQVDQELLRRLLMAEDYHVRAAAVRGVRYTGHQLEDQNQLLMEAVQDEHGRVRLEAIVAASWLDVEKGMTILKEAAKMPLDEWMKGPYETAVAHLNKVSVKEHRSLAEVTDLKGEDR